jgi:sortase (surface protein transpeptidase)
MREQRIVGETDASIIATTDTPQLTLLTCATWNWQAYKYLERRAVTADLVKIEPAEVAGN